MTTTAEHYHVSVSNWMNGWEQTNISHIVIVTAGTYWVFLFSALVTDYEKLWVQNLGKNNMAQTCSEDDNVGDGGYKSMLSPAPVWIRSTSTGPKRRNATVLGTGRSKDRGLGGRIVDKGGAERTAPLYSLPSLGRGGWGGVETLCKHS